MNQSADYAPDLLAWSLAIALVAERTLIPTVMFQNLVETLEVILAVKGRHHLEWDVQKVRKNVMLRCPRM